MTDIQAALKKSDKVHEFRTKLLKQGIDSVAGI